MKVTRTGNDVKHSYPLKRLNTLDEGLENAAFEGNKTHENESNPIYTIRQNKWMSKVHIIQLIHSNTIIYGKIVNKVKDHFPIFQSQKMKMATRRIPRFPHHRRWQSISRTNISEQSTFGGSMMTEVGFKQLTLESFCPSVCVIRYVSVCLSVFHPSIQSRSYVCLFDRLWLSKLLAALSVRSRSIYLPWLCLFSSYI